jgi:hypothetical protein
VLSFWAARALLVLHTALGVSAVASGTHLVIWLRRYVRGAQIRRSVLKFAWWFFALQLSAFTLGVTMYPTYKVEIRTAYLENQPAFTAEQAARDHAVAGVEKSSTREEPATTEMIKRAAKASRWFDVKEHWIALGLILSAATLLVLSLWRAEDGAAISPIVLAMATIACGTTWLGAIIGVLTAAWRAV